MEIYQVFTVHIFKHLVLLLIQNLQPSHAHGMNNPIAQIEPVIAQVIHPDLNEISVKISAEQFGHRSRVG